MVDWIGTPGNDTRTVTHFTDGYGLQGDDTLRSAPFATVGLVGGTGNDTYITADRSLTSIYEGGGDPFDVFIEAPTLTVYASFSLVQGRHLTLTNLFGNQGVVVFDWEQPDNRIETWRLADGRTLSFEAFRAEIYGSPLFIGDVHIDQVYGAAAAQAFDALVDFVRDNGAFLEQAHAPPPPPPPPLLGTGGPDVLDGSPGPDTIRGFSGADSIRGLDGNDVVHGDDGDDDVNGNLGNDTVHGGPDADFTRGGQGDDAVYGQDGDDWHVNGNIGQDSVYGGTGDDQVFGGPGEDSLFGEAGSDTLSGDLGNDRLAGGPGADRFLATEAGGWDIVLDFKRAEGDRIVLPLNINDSGIGGGPQLVERATSDGGGGSIVDLGGGHKLGIIGVAPGALVAEDFLVL